MYVDRDVHRCRTCTRCACEFSPVSRPRDDAAPRVLCRCAILSRASGLSRVSPRHRQKANRQYCASDDQMKLMLKGVDTLCTIPYRTRYLASKQPKSLTQRGQTTLATRTPLTGYRRVHEARADEARGREGRQERGPRREEGRYGRATATYLTVASHGPCVCSLGPCWQTRRR